MNIHVLLMIHLALNIISLVNFFISVVNKSLIIVNLATSESKQKQACLEDKVQTLMELKT